MELPQVDDYSSILLNDTPLLDVRAPIEFSQGAFPLAENFPLINNQEREEIGIRYKNQGQGEAINRGTPARFAHRRARRPVDASS